MTEHQRIILSEIILRAAIDKWFRKVLSLWLMVRSRDKFGVLKGYPDKKTLCLSLGIGIKKFNKIINSPEGRMLLEWDECRNILRTRSIRKIAGYGVCYNLPWIGNQKESEKILNRILVANKLLNSSIAVSKRVITPRGKNTRNPKGSAEEREKCWVQISLASLSKSVNISKNALRVILIDISEKRQVKVVHYDGRKHGAGKSVCADICRNRAMYEDAPFFAYVDGKNDRVIRQESNEYRLLDTMYVGERKRYVCPNNHNRRFTARIKGYYDIVKTRHHYGEYREGRVDEAYGGIGEEVTFAIAETDLNDAALRNRKSLVRAVKKHASYVEKRAESERRVLGNAQAWNESRSPLIGVPDAVRGRVMESMLNKFVWYYDGVSVLSMDFKRGMEQYAVGCQKSLSLGYYKHHRGYDDGVKLYSKRCRRMKGLELDLKEYSMLIELVTYMRENMYAYPKIADAYIQKQIGVELRRVSAS